MANLSFNLLAANGQLVNLPQPCVMGVINMSPNSFYQPYLTIEHALDTIAAMVAAGVSIIDVGGEATNPQVDLLAEKPSYDEELARVLPLIEAVKQRFPVLVSVDTSQPAVMRAAVMAGADMINDQRALQELAAVETVAELQTPVCLMHFFPPTRIPGSCSLPSMLQQVTQELDKSVRRCLQAGIDARRIIIDPGFGQGNYGKNCSENFYLLNHLPELTTLGYPLLAGWSRKSMIGDVLGVPPQARLYGSIAAATIAALKGAAIIRVHDVAETLDAMKVVSALLTTT